MSRSRTPSLAPSIRALLVAAALMASVATSLGAQLRGTPLPKQSPSVVKGLATPLGPPPEHPFMLQSQGPLHHPLSWYVPGYSEPPHDGVPGVAGYRIFRSERAGGTWVLRTPTLVSGVTQWVFKTWVDTEFVPPGAVYRITAVYTDGREGSVDFVYPNPPQPQIPTGFIVRQSGPGAVTLSWDPLPYAAFRLFGSGQPAGGTPISGTQISWTNVADGTYAWQLGADYGGVPGSPGPSASITLKTITSARYRVVANGFRVINHTNDLNDKLVPDGEGDEVYAGFAMFHVGRPQGQLLDKDLRSTHVHGDAGRVPGRAKAGTASLSGGLQNTDVFPAVLDPSQRYGQAPGDQTFPFLIWEGTLTNAYDAVIILPTLWETDPVKNDANQASYTNWFLAESAELPRVWADPMVQQAVQSTTIALTTPPGWTYFTAFDPLSRFDHPIGAIFDQHPNAGLGGMGKRLPRRAIILTREMIEAALASGSGIVTVPLTDQGAQGIVGNGHYIMYVQVESVP